MGCICKLLVIWRLPPPPLLFFILTFCSLCVFLPVFFLHLWFLCVWKCLCSVCLFLVACSFDADRHVFFSPLESQASFPHCYCFLFLICLLSSYLRPRVASSLTPLLTPSVTRPHLVCCSCSILYCYYYSLRCVARWFALALAECCQLPGV